jgi:myosin heavy subunit
MYKDANEHQSTNAGAAGVRGQSEGLLEQVERLKWLLERRDKTLRDQRSEFLRQLLALKYPSAITTLPSGTFSPQVQLLEQSFRYEAGLVQADLEAKLTAQGISACALEKEVEKYKRQLETLHRSSQQASKQHERRELQMQLLLQSRKARNEDLKLETAQLRSQLDARAAELAEALASNETLVLRLETQEKTALQESREQDMSLQKLNETLEITVWNLTQDLSSYKIELEQLHACKKAVEQLSKENADLHADKEKLVDRLDKLTERLPNDHQSNERRLFLTVQLDSNPSARVVQRRPSLLRSVQKPVRRSNIFIATIIYTKCTCRVRRPRHGYRYAIAK